MTGVTDTNKTTSRTTQAQSQPVMKSAIESNDTVMTGVSDNHNTTSHTAQAQSQPFMTTEGNDMLTNQPQLTTCTPVADKFSTYQQKWERYKNSINKARRQKYSSNSSPVRQLVRQAYSLDPSPIKACKREKYHLDPFPIKAHKREKYHLDPSPIKAQKRLSCLPHGIDRTIPYNIQCRSLYIYKHHELHFNVITDVLR